MILPRPSEGNVVTADKIVADISARVGKTNSDERVEWSPPLYTHDLLFSTILSMNNPISKLIEPEPGFLHKDSEESEQTKALRMILVSPALLDLNPKELENQFQAGELKDGSVVHAHGSSYFFRAPTILRNASGETISYYLIIRDLGSGVGIKQFLSSPESEKLRRAAREEANKRLNAERNNRQSEEVFEPAFIYVKGNDLTRIWGEYGRELAEGKKDVGGFIKKVSGNRRKVGYIAALNAMVILAHDKQETQNIHKVSFRRTGTDKYDFILEVEYKFDPSLNAETVSIDVAELAGRDQSLDLIPFPEWVYNAKL
jgi:hypothetical protein